MRKVQRLDVEITQSIHIHERKDIISVVGNNKEKCMEEIWKTIEEFDKYEVSNTGKVRNKETGKELKPWVINSGYYSVPLYKNGKGNKKTVHRIVAKTFIPNNDKSKNIVNHIDNNKLNNHIDNLEWVDYKGNTAHATKQGRLDTHSAREQLKKVSSKAVYQKDMEGNIISLWDSPTQAEVESKGYYTVSQISQVVSGRFKSHRGYKWEYVDKESKRSKSMKIDVFDLEGNLLYTEYSMNRVMKLLNMNNHKTLRDKLGKTNDFVEYKGYKFRNSK